MELIEVVLQGVQGSPAVSRWTLPPAAVAILPAGEREALFARAAFELLAGAPGAASALGEVGRAAVVVQGRDQLQYRVACDLATRRRALQVQEGDQLKALTTAPAEILQSLHAIVGCAPPTALRELFFAFVDDLPSRRQELWPAKVATSTSGKALPPGFDDDAPARESDRPLPPGFGDDDGVAQSPWLGRPETALRARLAELEAQDVTQLEFELDGLQKRMFELEALLKPLGEMVQGVELLQQQRDGLAHLDRLPADFLDRALALRKIKTEQEQSLHRLAHERERVITGAEHLSDDVSGFRQRGGVRPLHAAVQDPLVKFGGAIGVGAVVVGVVGSIPFDGLRWLALLNIPAFGTAVFGGIRVLGKLEEGASVRLRLGRLDLDKKRLDERFGIDKEQIERLLMSSGLTLDQLPELEEQWRLRADVDARLQLAREQLGEQQARAVGVEAERQASQARIQELDELLLRAGQRYDNDTELMKEKSDIEKILRGEVRARPLADTEERSAPSTPAAAPFDAGQRIVRVVAELLAGNVDDIAQQLAPRATQMAQALTDQRFSAVRFGAKAEVFVVDATSAHSIAFVQLPPGDRDLIALALRLASIEAFAKKERMPVVFDRVFDTFPVEKAPLFVRVLQFIGANTQVVCVTARRELAAAGVVVQPTT